MPFWPRGVVGKPKHPVRYNKDKSNFDEELDVIKEQDDSEFEHVYKAEMSQVTCYKCNRVSHFACNCKAKPVEQQHRCTFPVRHSKSTNNTIFSVHNS